MLYNHQFYLNLAKCDFIMDEVKFLSHVVGHKRVKMDHAKVSVIDELVILEGDVEFQFFLGLANYYMKFICGFS